MKIRVWLFFIALLFSSLTKGQEAKLMLPIGHTSGVFSLTFSKDDRFLLTAGDQTAKLWDVKTGLLLLSYEGHSSDLLGAKFYPDESRILSYSTDKTAKIWETKTGKLIATLNHEKKVFSAIFSSDGSKIITASDDGTAKIWDAQSGSLLTSLKGHFYGVTSAIFSKDGKLALTAGGRTAKIWDLAKGLPILNITGHNSTVFTAAFSKDETQVLTSSADSTAKLWDAKTGKLLLTLKGHQNAVRTAVFSVDNKRIFTSSLDETLKIWDSATGELLSSLKDVSGAILPFVATADGQKLITTGKQDYLINIWSVQEGTLLNSFNSEFYISIALNISHDGKVLAYADPSKNIKLMDLWTGKILNDLSGHTESIRNAFYTPDGNKILYSKSFAVDYEVMDVRNGKLMYNIVNVSSSVFSPDGEKILAVSRHRYEIKIFDTQNGQLIQQIPIQNVGANKAIYSPITPDDPKGGSMIVSFGEYSDHVKILEAKSGSLISAIKCKAQDILFSPDGKKIITLYKGDINIWDSKTGQHLQQLKNDKDNGYLVNIRLSPDGNMLAYDSNRSVKTWNTETGQLLLKLESGIPLALEFSPDSKLLGINSRDRLEFWELKSGKLFFQKDGYFPFGPIFLKKGLKHTSIDTILIGNYNNAELLNINTGKTIGDFVGHDKRIKWASFSPDQKHILTVSADNTMKFWDIATHQLLYTYIPIDSLDYLVVDKYNRYDGTEAARKLLYFTCGTEVIGLDQVKDQLWVPNLAQRIMNGETINSPKLADLQICGLTPEVEKVEQQDKDFHCLIKPRRGGLGETVLLVNDIEVKRYKPEQLQKTGANYMLHIPNAEIQTFFMAGKPNQVTVRSYTAKNDISSRGAVATNKAAGNSVPPNLYAVFVGVSDYKGEELDLKYAAKDAKDLSTALSASARKLLNIDGKEHVFTYHLTTKHGDIFPEKAAIKNTFEEIGKKATANDIFMVFFAGHGVMQGEKKQFYFLTADASINSATTAAGIVGIGTDELSSWMKPQSIKAQKRILIFDACNSGQAINEIVKIGQQGQNYIAARNDDKAEQIKAIEKLNEKSGLFILSASASNQSAYEMGRYNQGILTYALLRAMKEQPNILDGDQLNIGRWFATAEKMVTDLVSGNRQQPQVVSTTNFNIGIVDDQVRKAISLASEKALFTGSNFQNADEQITDDDLELTKLVNSTMNQVSARGDEGKIYYINGSDSPDAYSMSGRYTIKGDGISMKVSIKQNKAVKHTFEVSGSKMALQQFAQDIVKKAEGLVGN